MTEVSGTERRAPLRYWIIEGFAAANLGFLSLDVYLAHVANEFAHGAEWVPVIFSALAALLLLPGVAIGRFQHGPAAGAGWLVGSLSVGMGITGMVMHLEAAFFATQTLKSLVYSAPFVAPLSYVGVGLLLILNRMETRNATDWARWVLFLALAGFVGNFGLSLLDHAQNGFFEWVEWIPVVAAGYAVGFLLIQILRPGDRLLTWSSLGVMGTQVLIGVLGFLLHAHANIVGPSSTWENFIYGAPIFAPLLFANLAILAAIGLWELIDE